MTDSWIADRMHKIDASGIRKVFDLAAKMKNPINLSIGQPHYDTPEPVKQALHQAVDLGVNFFDTADVYGDGRSERLLAQLRSDRSEQLIIATKAGRRLDPHVASGYTAENLTAFVERSLRNLNTEALDLLQLHCPPTDIYYAPEVFEALDNLVKEGKIRFYGVSVERVEEALKAIEYQGVQSVQIIFNIFRQRPAELFFVEAQKREVGILARLPLSSGMLAAANKTSKVERVLRSQSNRACVVSYDT